MRPIAGIKQPSTIVCSNTAANASTYSYELFYSRVDRKIFYCNHGSNQQSLFDKMLQYLQ